MPRHDQTDFCLYAKKLCRTLRRGGVPPALNVQITSFPGALSREAHHDDQARDPRMFHQGRIWQRSNTRSAVPDEHVTPSPAPLMPARPASGPLQSHFHQRRSGSRDGFRGAETKPRRRRRATARGCSGRAMMIAMMETNEKHHAMAEKHQFTVTRLGESGGGKVFRKR